MAKTMQAKSSLNRGLLMKNFDSGFSTPLAMAAIFSLCILALSFCLLTAANERRMDSYKKLTEERKKIDSIIFDMEEKIQMLKNFSSDSDEHEILYLLSSACDFNLSVSDVSTGINKNFISKEILKNKAISDCIEINGEDIFAEYGWINPKISDKGIVEQTAKDFEGKNTFPLINTFPPLNIFNMSGDFIKAVLELCSVKDAENKAELIKDNLNPDTTEKELAEILEIEENHPVFELLGTKTAFWKVDFETEKARACAVFAAVPEKENQRKIEKYILVEKKILFKGGVL